MAIYGVVIKDANGKVKEVISAEKARDMLWGANFSSTDNGTQKDIKLVCKTCKKSFMGQSTNQKYCQSPCNRHNTKVACKLCKKMFTRKGHESYCNNPCIRLKRGKGKKYVPKEFDPAGICKMCGKGFVRKNIRIKYCHNPCTPELAGTVVYREKGKERNGSMMECRACKKQFMSFWNVRYCGDPCVKKTNAETMQAWRDKKNKWRNKKKKS